jgi:16S rRNA (cytidine1402-2'-O)-methyltransferase
MGRIADDDRATVIFEAPGRAAATLADLAAACGDNRLAALCRELTKLHEDVWRDALGPLSRRAADEPPRGEVTIVVAGRPAGQGGESTTSLAEGRAQVDRLVAQGWSRSSAARDVAQRTRLPRRDLFREA